MTTVLDKEASALPMQGSLTENFDRHVSEFRDCAAALYAEDIIQNALVKAGMVYPPVTDEARVLSGEVALVLLEKLPKEAPEDKPMVETFSELLRHIVEAWIAASGDAQKNFAVVLWGRDTIPSKEEANARRKLIESTLDKLNNGNSLGAIKKAGHILSNAWSTRSDPVLTRTVARWVGHRGSLDLLVLIGSVLKNLPDGINTGTIFNMADFLGQNVGHVAALAMAMHGLHFHGFSNEPSESRITGLDYVTFTWKERVVGNQKWLEEDYLPQQLEMYRSDFLRWRKEQPDSTPFFKVRLVASGETGYQTVTKELTVE